jgi:hypothetical protein
MGYFWVDCGCRFNDQMKGLCERHFSCSPAATCALQLANILQLLYQKSQFF